MQTEKGLEAPSLEEMLARAETAVAALRDTYRVQLAEDVERLFTLWEELQAGLPMADFLKRVHAVAHDIKGQGGSFGYELATDIGASLCAHANAEEGAFPSPNILHLHFRMLRAVSQRDLAGDGGASGNRFRAKLAQLQA